MVLRLRGYGAWIESDGEPLEEYAIEVEGDTVSCYICSEEGKGFVLHFDDDGSAYPGDSALSDNRGRSTAVKIDGSLADRVWGGFKREVISEGVQKGDFVKLYDFTPIVTTDDDDVAAEDDAKNEHIGTIQVEVKRGIKLGSGTTFDGPVLSTGPIHERSKKAGSHRVALGKAVYKPQSGVRTVYTDHTPWVTFRFLYRKRDVLMAQGILPHSPIPSPSPPPDNSSGPSVKVEGGSEKGKGVKRGREENLNNDTIIISDDDDLDSTQRLQGRTPRKKAKREAVTSVDDIIDLT